LCPSGLLSLSFLWLRNTAGGVRKTPVESRERFTPWVVEWEVFSEDLGIGSRSGMSLGLGSDDDVEICVAWARFEIRSLVGAVAGRRTGVWLSDCRRDGVVSSGNVVLKGSEAADVSVGDC